MSTQRANAGESKESWCGSQKEGLDGTGNKAVVLRCAGGLSGDRGARSRGGRGGVAGVAAAMTTGSGDEKRTIRNTGEA